MSNVALSVLYSSVALPLGSFCVSGPNASEHYFERKEHLYSADTFRAAYKVMAKVKTYSEFLEKIVDIWGSSALDFLEVSDWSFGWLSSDHVWIKHFPTLCASIKARAGRHSRHEKISLNELLPLTDSMFSSKDFDGKQNVVNTVLGYKQKGQVVARQIEILLSGVSLNDCARQVGAQLDSAFLQTSYFTQRQIRHAFVHHPANKPMISLGFNKDFSRNQYVWQNELCGILFKAHPILEDTVVLLSQKSGDDLELHFLAKELTAVLATQGATGPQGNLLKVVSV